MPFAAETGSFDAGFVKPNLWHNFAYIQQESPIKRTVWAIYSVLCAPNPHVIPTVNKKKRYQRVSVMICLITLLEHFWIIVSSIAMDDEPGIPLWEAIDVVLNRLSRSIRIANA